MTLHGDLAAGARAAHAHFFGTAVTLSEPGAADASITASLHKARTETRTDESGRQNRVTLRDAILHGITNVRHDATIAVGGELWAIDQVMSMETSGLRVQLMRVQRHANERTSYRGRS